MHNGAVACKITRKKTNEEKQMKTRDDTGHRRLPHPHE